MSTITADCIRGNTDMIILAQLMQEDSYGYRINHRIREVTDQRYELKEATLYTAFRRLEESGYISSYWGDESGGARRRYYSITVEGRQAFEKMLKDWKSAHEIISNLIEIQPSKTEAL